MELPWYEIVIHWTVNSIKSYIRLLVLELNDNINATMILPSWLLYIFGIYLNQSDNMINEYFCFIKILRTIPKIPAYKSFW